MANLYDVQFNIVEEVTRAAGGEWAVKLCREFGGRTVYISAKPNADYWLSKLVGHAHAIAIAGELGAGRGVRVLIPMYGRDSIREKRQAAFQIFRKGGSTRDVAIALGVHERTAFR